ncbi:hypothetical protein GCWU000246_00009 [Jonquetella anthropi E3_33 E1]|nr:hypothetical protein GCWU000246_00009 [Jonquetella anthropi E3_33 E1]
MPDGAAKFQFARPCRARRAASFLLRTWREFQFARPCRARLYALKEGIFLWLVSIRAPV